jgi:DHA2 family multidrug resistance protein-like MFS transporter
MPLYLMRLRGFTAAQTGILLGAQSAARAAAAPLSGRSTDWWSARGIAAAGVAILATALWMMCCFDNGTPLLGIGATLAVLGAGTGVFVPANSKALMGAAPAGQYGMSAGVLSTARNLGMTLGTAWASLLYSASGGSGVQISIAATAGLATVFAWCAMPARRAAPVGLHFRFNTERE